MAQIRLLEQTTIDQIAAGEVVERPASVVKELVENSIDAGANAVTVEIKDGGISLIRVTDNGEGIAPEEVEHAFLRHATSKISSAEDLLSIGSLGFRGEALSSISSVSRVELITKQPQLLTGLRCRVEGGVMLGTEQIGAPQGSTFIVRDLFYNTPARKKFLKSATTEAGYVNDLIEHLALSHPEISFQFISNTKTKLHTSGNHNLKDIIYSIYGREIASQLIEVSGQNDQLSVTGFIGKPSVSRGNRNFENYYVNGRYVRDQIISKAIEDGYASHMMQHRYPFTVLLITMPGTDVDVNVHPAKREVRFSDGPAVYNTVLSMISEALAGKEMIPQASVESESKMRAQLKAERSEARGENESAPQPFENIRRSFFARHDTPYSPMYPQHSGMAENSRPAGFGTGNDRPEELGKHDYTGKTRPAESGENSNLAENGSATGAERNLSAEYGSRRSESEFSCQLQDTAANTFRNAASQISPPAGAAGNDGEAVNTSSPAPRQMDLFDDRLLSKENIPEHRIIGQLFETYWLVEFRDNLYIIDQHAAHEKVIYERLRANMKEKTQLSQQVSPPIVISLSMKEEQLLAQYQSVFEEVGFEISPFGGRDYAITAVPDNLYGFTEAQLFTQMLDSLSEVTAQPSADFLYEKLAMMACKAAVKGNTKLSDAEAQALIKELLELENPYNCPHGRPTIISMSKYEIDKKFKRII